MQQGLGIKNEFDKLSSKDDGGLNISFPLGRDYCLWLGKKKKGNQRLREVKWLTQNYNVQLV